MPMCSVFLACITTGDDNAEVRQLSAVHLQVVWEGLGDKSNLLHFIFVMFIEIYALIKQFSM